MVRDPEGTLPIPTRAEVISRQQDAGGKVGAVFPIHYPRALLRACGALPVEVWGPPGRDQSLGDTHLQPYTCSIVRSSLAFVLQHGLDAADLLLVPHGCDSLQGLGSLLLDLLDVRLPVLTQYLPRGEGPAAVEFLADELGTLRQRLAEVTGHLPSDQELLHAIEREERADALLTRLFAERELLDLSEREFYRIARSREFLPAEDFASLAEAALERRRTSPLAGIRLLLSGVLPEPVAVLDVIEQAGALIVADDLLCTGRRLYRPGDSPKPLRRMAQSLLSAAPDTTRGSSAQDRVNHLTQLAQRSQAEAALFYIVKSCEPEQFYLPLVRKALEQHGLPTLALEIDVSEPLSGQAITRIEALMENVA